MDELLETLLGADLLTDETRQQITETFQAHVDNLVEERKQEVETQVRAELTEEWVKERETLIEAIDNKVGEFLNDELSQLKEDIDRFRDLEAEFAGKLVEERAAMQEELKNDMATLLAKIDGFLEERLQVEFDELREDIEEVKKYRFGSKIFEAVKDEFNVMFVDEDSVQAKLHETTEKLAEMSALLNESETRASELHRATVLNELLQPLAGRQRDIMETILNTTATDKLSETYGNYIGRIVNESVNPESEKEGDEVLAEGDEQSTVKKAISEQVIVKDGNKAPTINESLSNEIPTLDESEVARLRRLSGQLQ